MMNANMNFFIGKDILSAINGITLGDLLLIDQGRGFTFNIKILNPDSIEISMNFREYTHRFTYTMVDDIDGPSKEFVLAGLQTEADNMYKRMLWDKVNKLFEM